MTGILKISLLLILIVIKCSARSIGNFPTHGGALTDTTAIVSTKGGSAASYLGTDSNVATIAESTGSIQAVSPPQVNHNEQTAKAITDEENAAERAHEKAKEEVSLGHAGFNAARKSVGECEMEAEKQSQSAVLHLAKANAAAERKVKAAAEEKKERKTAKEDNDISEKIRKSSALKFASAEREAGDIDKLVARLNKLAAEHEARARAAQAEAERIASSDEEESQTYEYDLNPDVTDSEDYNYDLLGMNDADLNDSDSSVSADSSSTFMIYG